MITLIVAALVSLSPPPDPLLPTLPPPLPTYITHDDGTRSTCTPDYQWCWSDKDDRGY